MIRILALLFVVAGGPFAPLSAQAPRPGVIPLEYEDARVYVPVEAGGRTHWFILDTGAFPTVIDTGLASSIGLHGRDTTSVTGVGAGAMRQARGDATTIRVGGRALALAAPPIAPIDALLSPYTGRHAPGILGSRFFTDVVVTLDFDDHTVTVRDSLDRRELEGAIMVPLTIQNDIPYVQATLRFAGRAAIDARLLVDLGAKATLLLSEPFIARAKLADIQAHGVSMPLGAGVGGETRYAFARFDRLELAGIAATRLDSGVAGLSVGGTLRGALSDGLLGAEYLSRYRVTLDYRHRRMILRPRRSVPPAAAFDMSGMFVKASGADLRTMTVSDVAPGSSAAAAGIHVGDRIMSVNGRAAGMMTLAQVRDALRDESRPRVRLLVERAGQRIEATVMLVRRV